jgi:hypothetical protein
MTLMIDVRNTCYIRFSQPVWTPSAHLRIPARTPSCTKNLGHFHGACSQSTLAASSAPRTCISGTLSLFALATNGCALVLLRRSRTSTRSHPTKLRPLRTSQAPWSRATLARRSRLRNGQRRVRSGKCLAMFLPSSDRANATP